MVKVLLLIAGGALGTVFRYQLSNWIQHTVLSAFPYGILAVNIAGSFVIGFCWSLSDAFGFSSNFKLFLFTGLLGGFTTFSSFTLDAMLLLKAGEYKIALSYILASNILGLSAVFLGYLLGKYASALIK
ncbi:fluoride efflux transporter CrcB [Massilibacteroides vaginae]|uniref:fluoride efflux transporter CrcB n=1 Tax=Massilibacteroides vaginae TaxID=1673718 RepID=UPI000A1CB81B|nr:fluoride efflux transporter CrcB [Massilibacteroides vaginae]